MKTRSLFGFLTMIIFLIMISCTQDKFITNEDSPTTEDMQWKPSDGIAQFIPSEYKDNIRAEDIEYAERILRNPKEELLSARGTQIHLAAGSVDALAAAIASAGNGDVIVLDPGDHFESGTNYINKSVNIWGNGANYIASGLGFSSPSNVKSAIHITPKGCISTIRGITFKSTDAHPGVGIFLENTRDINIAYNKFENWNNSIFLASSNYCSIIGNYIVSDPGGTADGIDISDGVHNQVMKNECSKGFFGIFFGGSQGINFANKTHNCFIGQIFCKVPPGGYLHGGTTVDGYDIDTKGSASKWLGMFNKADTNAFTAYLIIDGANNNLLQRNTSTGNGAYDYYLVGDSHLFGFFTPKAFNNTVRAYSTQIVKDCAENSTIYGGIRIDTSLDPCN